MLTCLFQIIGRVSKTTHSQLVARINNRDAIFIQFLLRLESYCQCASRRGNADIAARNAAGDRAQSAESSTDFRRGAFRLLDDHATVSCLRVGCSSQSEVDIA